MGPVAALHGMAWHDLVGLVMGFGIGFFWVVDGLVGGYGLLMG